MASQSLVESFQIPSGSSRGDAHAAVQQFIDEVVETTPRSYYYGQIELKSVENGRKLLEAAPEHARQLVLAAVEQTSHWDNMAERVRAQGKTASERINAHFLPGWEEVWKRRQPAAEVIKALTRRSLPFDDADLQQLVGWCNQATTRLSSYTHPLGNIVRALQRFAERQPASAELAAAVADFAKSLRATHDKDTKRLATAVEQLWPAAQDEGEPADEERPRAPAPIPALAGGAAVLTVLKYRLGMAPAATGEAILNTGPDNFPVAADSPYAAEHGFISAYFEEVVQTNSYYGANPNDFQKAAPLLSPPRERAAAMLLAAAERHVHAVLQPESDLMNQQGWKSRYAATGLTTWLDYRDVPWTRDETFDAILFASTDKHGSGYVSQNVLGELMTYAERCAAELPLTEGERYVLSLLRASHLKGPALGAVSDDVARLTRLIGDGAKFYLAPGEVWADDVNATMSALPSRQSKQWCDLFSHLLGATSAKPSKAWLKTAKTQVDALGEAVVVTQLQRWLPLVAKGRSVRQLGSYTGDTRGGADTMNDENATILRGLLWLVPTLKDRDSLIRLVTEVCLSAYKKVPGVGPRAVKVGNAAVYALSEIASAETVGQLAILKVRVKFGTAQKEIEKAFTKAAEALNLPRADIEEMGIPSYGLTEVGLLAESLGDYEGRIVVTGADAELTWQDKNGKALKSTPARVTKEFHDDLKELKQTLKDVKAMLPAQRDRIDAMFLAQKTWPHHQWQERYSDHPLVGTIARRLIWCVDGEPALFVDGTARSVDGAPIEHGSTAEISLWHPVGRPVDEVLRWRERLAELQITQPFKQAHREIYLLTAAEENTRTYSNRFAAHVIRQHQFNALCAARGWKNKLRLMVDDCYAPPSRQLLPWNLRAEFWVEGIGDEYGRDTNESGSFLYLSTDQVRFYRTEAADNYAHAGGGGYTTQAAGPGRENINDPLPLAEIPPLVLSEIMRDVDLFVGVASVGNDPSWNDGGPEGRYREYWSNVSFGELSASASTRKEVLERLIPRLKIAPRCTFSDRFLVVQGNRRTYKIHLGSGNILMEPNDEYLCIVPDSRTTAQSSDVYLPFEGDRTLSIIISKAILLAADDKIKDSTILRQIEK